MESVDYVNTFITIAPDSTATAGEEPLPKKDKPTVASATFEMVARSPYEYRSSDVIFTVWADRRDIAEDEREEAWAKYYSKGQACLRASDLGKRYGWGIHANAEGYIAIYEVGSKEYEQLVEGTSPVDGNPVTVKAAMRSKR